jgi:hypothetical protein
MTIPRVVLGLSIALALAACSPVSRRDQSSRATGQTLEQGRTYTNWLYGAEYGKLWERFTPELQRVFGSASELGAFAGRAVTQLGQERKTVDEQVAELKPERLYSRTAAFTAARLPVVIEWTLTKDGAVSGLAVRPAAPDSAPATAAKDSVKSKK